MTDVAVAAEGGMLEVVPTGAPMDVPADSATVVGRVNVKLAVLNARPLPAEPSVSTTV